MNKNINKIIENSFWGGVIGDVLGTPIEFIDYNITENFGPITTVLNNNKRGIKAGMYSDDTCMTLALMDSLIHKHKIDLNDQMFRYSKWLNDGEYTCTSYSYGSGRTTRSAINYYNETGEFRDNSLNNNECGNGSLMRTAPIVWALYRNNKSEVLSICAKCSTPTHNHILCKAVCKMFGSILYDILNGVVNKRVLLDNCFNEVLCEFKLKTPTDYHNYSELLKIVDSKYEFLKDELKPDEFNPMIMCKENTRITGYAPITLMCALWAFFTTNNFYDGLIKAVNIPGDCDTIGSIYGQLAGAYYCVDQTNKRNNVKTIDVFDVIQNKEFLCNVFNKFVKTKVRINELQKKRTNNNKSTK